MRELTWQHRLSRDLGLCRSTDCVEFTDDGHLYCSHTCALRERSRRDRYRELLRRDADRCITCGTKHRPGGRVAL